MWYLPGTRRPLAALSRRFFLSFSPERPQREELVPAGYATKRRQSEKPPNGGCLPRDMFRRDALQFQVAADSAAGIQHVPKRCAASAKSCLTRLATPRQNATDA